MSDANASEACSASERLMVYLLVTGSTLASLTVLLLRALPTLLQNCG